MLSESITFGTVVLLFLLVLVVFAIKYGVKIVPQSDNWLVERLGKYNRTLGAGVHIIMPFFENVRYKVAVQEIQLPPDPINAITHDNVSIKVQLAILYRIVDPSRTMYRIENLELGIKTIINGTVRSVLGKTNLDGVQSNRRDIALEIEGELQGVADEWGVKLTRVEVTEIDVDQKTKDAMQIQLNAERMRRGAVTQAEGDKQATQLEAEAKLYSAQKEAEAKRVIADAEAYAVSAVAKAISEGGSSAVDFEIRKIQAKAIGEISKGTNSKIVLLPNDVVSSLSGVFGRIYGKD